MRQWDVLRESNWFSFPRCFERLGPRHVCLAGDNYQRTAIREENAAKFDPVLDRPVLGLAAAAGMEGDHCARPVEQVFHGVSVFVGRKKVRGRIRKRKAKSGERTRQLEGCVLAIVEFGWPGDERPAAGLLDIRFKNRVRVVEITEDQIEAAKVFE